ncbi:DUF484 family protein [Limnobacter humi]|uniref:DUF484 family protein n=1 Tax=Limnobacter humi TaxID=1778671 RepID=A0ABT1WBC7_9BURK|nr:DUF484 family protein [Limnobacter humi]MCQ8894826.1 DUF484 family protein [Limnobacter humi]
MSEEAQKVVDFLKANPEFLIRNPGVLAFVRLPEQTSGNVASLQDRQLQTMREKVKALEHRIADMSNAAVENQAIINKLQAVSRTLLTIKDVATLPLVLTEQIKQQFQVPMVRLSLWLDSADAQSTDRNLFSQMKGLYCGFADHAPSLAVFEGEEIHPRSVVLMPIRVGASPDAFGVLGLGSPDKDRFAPTLETDFLNTLAEIACAALSRLQAPSH